MSDDANDLVTYSVELNGETVRFIEAIAEDAECSWSRALSRALGLFRIALDAHKKGLHVGSTEDESVLETKFVGFVGPGEDRREFAPPWLPDALKSVDALLGEQNPPSERSVREAKAFLRSGLYGIEAPTKIVAESRPDGIGVAITWANFTTSVLSSGGTTTMFPSRHEDDQ